MKTGSLKGSICALFVVLLFTAAEVTPAARRGSQKKETAPPVNQSASEAPRAPAQLKIILLKPSIRFEDANGKTPKIRATEEEYGRLLTDAARKVVGSKAKLLDVEALDAPAGEACRPLGVLASRLARGDVNEEAAGDLARLSALDEQYAVLVQFLRVKSGPGWSWSPLGGQMTSSMASTLVQAALLSGRSGKVIWKGERFIRKNLKPADSDFRKALTQLYMDFDIK